MQLIQKKQLIKSLESVKRGIANRELIEQSTSFIFKDNKVIAYNDEIFAMTDTELDITGAIPAEPLLKLLSKCKDDEIKVGVSETGNELQIKGKKFSSGILFDTDIRIPIDNIITPTKFKKLESDFTSAAKLACLTAGTSLSEPLLTCVHVYKNNVESCDNERITICDVTNTFDFDILIPAKNLLSLCSEKLIEVGIDDAWVHFKTDNDVILSTRLFNEKYVDLTQFIPENLEGKEIAFPANMDDILVRADVFSKDVISQEKIITLSFRNGRMEIAAKNEKGWFKEKAAVNFKEDLQFSINIDFLRDILKITKSISVLDETIFFETENSKHLIQLEK